MTPEQKLERAIEAAWHRPGILLSDLFSIGAKSKAFEFIAKRVPGDTIDEVGEAYAAGYRKRNETAGRWW